MNGPRPRIISTTCSTRSNEPTQSLHEPPPATGVTAYLKNGGALEKAARMANHAADVTLDEVEAILV